jgi:hypothetical protein
MEWGRGFLPSTPQAEVYTDASETGWGIVHASNSWSGIWSPSELPQHINWKELMVIWKTINLPHLRGTTIRIMCDNATAIAYVNKFGGTRSPVLMTLARSIWDHCLTTNTRIQVAYVPPPFNPADSPSRQLTMQLEWRLAPPFFQRLDEEWGPHHVDLFASRDNHQVPKFVSWKWDPTAIATDALSFP